MQTHRLQHGLSLPFALIALVILSLAITSLVRSLDFSATVVGNYAFQQDATEASASAAQRAIDWIESNQASLDADHADRGYYASSLDTLAPTSTPSSANQAIAVDWDGNQTCSRTVAGVTVSCVREPYPPAAQAAGNTINGNHVQWIITRLCKTTGAPGVSNPCLQPRSTNALASGEQGELVPGGRAGASGPTSYFRIVVRATGPRNTVSFTETLVHF